ncbi:transglutaminase-like domain-containing protein [Cognatiyoonia sp. IB215182]|uniref:transglutaminase-like domain-containing protein n=1 Tax=Cognatiyoonia sp. IB215182 TaxID=3097353 RepID=UPI002A0E62AD|nr:transglutaminase-like domain-containing protein [Cognatiyoonia sp. IB215182]MDX8352932.1 transglutaminase-like domain-containing protein [Cognatiyoonia sp. IB215182]
MFSKCTHWLAIFAMLSTAVPQPLVAQDLSPDLREQLEEMTDILADIADVTSDGADLPGVVLQAVGTDAAALVDYVGSRIAYVPYTGVLRGADGTLRSGYGNSYDQSLALITLLRRAGYEAQILVGPETEGAFSTTRQDFPVPDNNAEVQDLIAELEELTQELVDSGAVDAPPALPEPEVAAFDTTIAPQAAAAAVDLLDLTPVTPTPEAADIYALVRYRQGPSDSWAYADAAKNTVFETLDTEAYLKLNEQVPTEHQHRTKVTVVVESALGSVPVATLEAPSANIADRPISFGFAPSGRVFGVEGISPFDPWQDLVFMSDTLPQSVITLEGQLIPLDVAANAMAGVFKTGAGLLNDAAASLESGEEQMRPLLDRITFRVTTIAPGGQDIRGAERILIDRAGVLEQVEENDEAFVRSTMLAAASGTVMLYSGVSPRTEAEREADQIQALTKFIASLLNDPDDTQFSRFAAEYMNVVLQEALAFFFADETIAVHVSSSVAALRTVSVVTSQSEILEFALMTDILIDGRLAKDVDSALSLAVEAAGREHEIVTRLARTLELPSSRLGSFEALQSAIGNETQPISLSSFVDDMPSNPNYERQAQIDFLLSQEQAGKSISIWPGATPEETVWLEFDQANGTARLASGGGAGNATEKIAVTTLTALALVSALFIGIAKCYNAPGGPKVGCGRCVMGAFVLGIGAPIAASFGVAASVIKAVGFTGGSVLLAVC